MAQRIFFKIPTMFKSSNESTVVDVNVTPTKVSFKITSNYEQEQGIDLETGENLPTVPVSETVYDFDLDLSVLKSAKRFLSNTLYGIVIIPNSSGNLTERNIVNISELTKPLRLDSSVSSKLNFGFASQPFLQILVKDPNGTFEDHDIIVITNNNTSVVSNEEFTESDYSAYATVSLLDTISVAKDEAFVSDDYVQYIVTTQPYVGEVYLEQVYGIINKTRCTIGSDGTGVFRVQKSSVDSEGIKVRLGFSSYVNLTTLIDTL